MELASAVPGRPGLDGRDARRQDRRLGSGEQAAQLRPCAEQRRRRWSSTRQTGTITRSANIAPRQTFCSLIASLPDGRLAIIGGGSDSGAGATPDVQIYDSEAKTFSVMSQMNFKRWYPGGTLDRDGNMIVAGGSSNGDRAGERVLRRNLHARHDLPRQLVPRPGPHPRRQVRDRGRGRQRRAGAGPLPPHELGPQQHLQHLSAEGTTPRCPHDDRPVHDVLQRGRNLEGEHDPRRRRAARRATRGSPTAASTT